MRVEDLFPVCQAATCPQRGKHKHVLPTQTDLIQAAEKYVLSVGGYQSGKTLAACILCLLLMLSIPGNRGFVGRRTYDKLHDSTLRTFLEVLERASRQYPALGQAQHLERFRHYPHRIALPNGSEIIFRETKDVGRHLGPSYGFIYLDEIQEEPEDTFTRLKGRLSLPLAAGNLKFICTTNPSHKNHWMYRWFGLEPGRRELEDPAGALTYRHIRSSPRDNPHLPADYVWDLLTLDPNEIRRVVEGLPGYTPDGPPVFPEFKHNRHIGVPDLLPVALIRSWDWGFRHPACSWQQMWTCKLNRLHLNILDELDAEHVEAEEFGRRVLARTKLIFPDAKPSMVLEVGDAQGAEMTDKGPGAIILLGRPPFNLRFRYRKVSDIDPGLELVRRLLRTQCPCGTPTLLIHRRCRNIVDALAGGYHYPRTPTTTSNERGYRKDKPTKDGFYDDFADTIRYNVDVMVRQALADPNWQQATAEAPHNPWVGSPGWGWMEVPVTADQVRTEVEASKRRSS